MATTSLSWPFFSLFVTSVVAEGEALCRQPADLVLRYHTGTIIPTHSFTQNSRRIHATFTQSMGTIYYNVEHSTSLRQFLHSYNYEQGELPGSPKRFVVMASVALASLR